MSATISFALPDSLIARAPPERRGLARDAVRLLVIDRTTHAVRHMRFDHIAGSLRPGDRLVLNASRTLPAVFDARTADGRPVEVRLAGHRPDDSWSAQFLSSDGRIAPGQTLSLADGLEATIVRPDDQIPWLWVLRFDSDGPHLFARLARLGRPVRYEYAAAPWPLDDYQTVYARAPGSAEMPSAGRAFTWRLLFDLRRRGIATSSIILHTGLSSYLDDALDAAHHVPAEEYVVTPDAAREINRTRANGGRVVAVGTTVVRALETVADDACRIRPGHGLTRLRVTADTPLRAVDGLLTGLHEPEASHLDLLTAFAPAGVIQKAYEEAVARGYLWHEFGDLNLIL